MPKKNEPLYQDSLLKKINHHLLIKIDALEKKYSSNKHHTAPHILEDIDYANNKIKDLRKIIQLIDTGLAPKFDARNKPNGFSYLDIIRKLIALDISEQFLLTRTSLFYSTLSYQLANCINHSNEKNPGQVTVDDLIDDIKQYQNELFQEAQKIPGTDFNSLLDDVKQTLLSIMTEHDLTLNNSADACMLLKLFQEKTASEHNISEFFAPTITHPIMFELIETFIAISNELPLELYDLGHFFNPESLSIDLHNGFVGSTFKKIANTTFQLHNKPKTDADIFTRQAKQLHLNSKKALPFTYEMILGEDQPFVFNIAIEYAIFLPMIKKTLLTSITHYFNDYSATRFVQSQQTRIDLIWSVVNHEIDQFKQKVTEHFDAFTPKKNYTILEDLQKKIIDIELQLEQNNALQKIFLNKKTSITQQPIINLLINHPELKEKLIFAEQNELDISWQHQPLPNQIIGSPEQGRPVEIIPIARIVNNAFDDDIRSLNSHQNMLRSHLRTLQKKQLLLINNQQKEDFSAMRTNDWLTEYQQRLTAFQNNLEQAQNNKLTIDNTIAQLKNHSIPELKSSVDDIAKRRVVAKNDLDMRYQNIRKELVIGDNSLIANEMQSISMESSENPLVEMKTIIDIIENKISIAMQKKQQIENTAALSRLLQNIYNCVRDDPKEIPLQKIVQLLRSNYPDSKEKINFRLLLSLIDQLSSVEIWQNYFKKNSGIFSSNTKAEFNQLKQILLSQIEGKQKALEPVLEQKDEQTQLCINLSSLLEISQQQVDIMLRFQDYIERVQEEYNEKIGELKHHESDYSVARQQYQSLMQDIPQYAYHIIMIENSINIHHELLLLNTDVDELINRGEDSLELLNNLSDTGNDLMLKITRCLEDNQDIVDNQYYQQRLENYQSMLATILTNLTDKIAMVSPAVSVLEQPIEQPKINIAYQQKLLDKLDNYWNKRAKTYRIKDMILSQDKHRREQFINDLKKKLNNWYYSGDSTELMTTLKQNLNNFPGHNLSTVLNQIMVTVIKHSPKKPVIDNSYSDNIKNILDGLEESNPTYVKAINNLYQQIITMDNHGNYLDTHGNSFHGKPMIYLAKKLTQDLNYFVKEHQQTLPTPAACQLFIDSFSARLHSKDDLLNHHTSWKPLVGNIVIGIAGLGIVLGIKLAWSKLTTGRFCFFFEQTEAHKQINCLEKQVLTIPALFQ